MVFLKKENVPYALQLRKDKTKKVFTILVYILYVYAFVCVHTNYINVQLSKKC